MKTNLYPFFKQLGNTALAPVASLLVQPFAKLTVNVEQNEQNNTIKNGVYRN